MGKPLSGSRKVPLEVDRAEYLVVRMRQGCRPYGYALFTKCLKCFGPDSRRLLENSELEVPNPEGLRMLLPLEITGRRVITASERRDMACLIPYGIICPTSDSTDIFVSPHVSSNFLVWPNGSTVPRPYPGIVPGT